MEEQRRLAETVPETLFLIAYKATVAGGLLHHVAALHADLSAAAAVLRADGEPPATGLVTPDPHLGWFPSVRRELFALCRLYVDASRTFVPAGAALGLNHGPIWGTWRSRRADTIRRFVAAVRRFRVARRQARALEDAFVAARTFPRGSLGWFVWMGHARRFATHAAVAVAMLFDASCRLRDAAAGEFIAARMVLYRDGIM